MERLTRCLVPALVLTLALTAGCRGDKDQKNQTPPPPAVEGAAQPDPAALRQAVDLAVERRLADSDNPLPDRRDPELKVRVRAVEARLGRHQERLDGLERTLDSARHASGPTEDAPKDTEPPEEPPVEAPEEPEAVSPPVEEPQPDIVEAPAEDVVAEPAEGERTLGFLPAPPPEGEDAVEPALILTRAAVAPSIDREAREPVDPGTVFDSSVGKLYAFLTFKNTTEEEHEVAVIWKKNGKELSRLPDLKVGPMASRWRTWAYVTVNERRRGDWTVEIQGPGEVLLGQVNFRVD